MTTLIVEITAGELCQRAGIADDVLAEMVAQGILVPVETRQPDWHFDVHMISLARRAVRLHQELDIDWAGIAVVLDLLNELEHLRKENRALRQRLARFLMD